MQLLKGDELNRCIPTSPLPYVESTEIPMALGSSSFCLYDNCAQDTFVCLFWGEPACCQLVLYT